MTVLTHRFWAKVTVAPSGCWEWTGARSSKGYGQWSVRGVSKSIHRLTWQEFRGPIPDGLVIDHLCRVRHCCNPDHMEVVTGLVNAQRGEPATKDRCLRGHPLIGANLLTHARGQRTSVRNCRICYVLGRRATSPAKRPRTRLDVAALLADVEALLSATTERVS